LVGKGGGEEREALRMVLLGVPPCLAYTADLHPLLNIAASRMLEVWRYRWLSRDALLLVDWEGAEERGGCGGRIKYNDL
jgi:hypothetical protein